MHFIENHTQDLWLFRLTEETLVYGLNLVGNQVKQINRYQGCISDQGHAHLFLLNKENQLTHHLWDGRAWHKSTPWTKVDPFFRGVLAQEGNAYLVFTKDGKGQFASYTKGIWQTIPLPFLTNNHLPLGFYDLTNAKLILIYKEITNEEEKIFYRYFFLDKKKWGEPGLLMILPPIYNHFKLCFFQKKLYFIYTAGIEGRLYLDFFDSEKGTFLQKTPFADRLQDEDYVFLTKLEQGLLALIILEENNLTYWLSKDLGQTWKTKGKITHPWSLNLLPIETYQQELTHLIAINGFLDLEFKNPGIIEARKLLGFKD